ncbi:MAG TPA: hypothetical protein VNV37_10465 [Solirubrobacteraceae bacterium]|nr:hypothetical protein [Solirubrobacteraceae bacterium]
MLLLGFAIATQADAAESPSFSMLPDTLAAGAPAGYTLNLSIPASGGTGVKQMSVTLPQGAVISPAAGGGLGTCSKEQFALESSEAATCPLDSQVGTALLEASAHSEPQQGQVFLGEPSCGAGGICTPADAQSGRMVRLLVQVDAGEPAVPIKLEGIGEIDQQTDQLTVSFEQLPPVQFVDLKLSLNGGQHALLANPRTCGQASSDLTLVPSGASSAPEFLANEFSVTEGCITPQFHPTAAVAAASGQALGYDPLTFSFGRADADEYISAIQTTLPEGLLPNISSVPLCGEAQASAGTCPAGSLIGHAAVQMGPGTDPASVEGGQVFFTGPYKGAPFGLSIVIPARVGPYTLAGTNGAGELVVRAAVNVNPRTAVLTVTSDPLPSALDGIPLQLRLIQLALDRPDFITNPSSCAALQVTSTLASVQNATASITSPFQASNCGGFTFAPTFAVSTPAKTSRIDGTSLYVKITDPSTDTVAWKVEVELPKKLSARLSTLQKACSVATFESNPAGCPPGSLVGVARTSTPLVAGAFAGPAYFVSYGASKFPELVIVLQNDGVRIDLHGETFISKAGITSSTFATIPDVFVTYFEMILPAGPDSALTANGNLCQGPLVIPNEFAGQNGAAFKRSTQIAVTGCPKGKRGDPAKRRHHHHRGQRSRRVHARRVHVHARRVNTHGRHGR